MKLVWRKSSYSGGAQNCHEVAWGDKAVYSRDSKNPAGGTIQTTPKAWAAFVRSVAK
ncbi:MAG TPA: DUF397 domain-containing protein [Pseudonocardiaceae bacterium]|jgi:hypothetical protein|nr:DUF397 domain-containing protein [Pseudonocardiaceae bacterium]